MHQTETPRREDPFVASRTRSMGPLPEKERERLQEEQNEFVPERQER